MNDEKALVEGDAASAKSDRDESENLYPPRKLDLGYFTDKGLCPALVHAGNRLAFEIFLMTAGRFLASRGVPVSPTHEEFCQAGGLPVGTRSSRNAISRALRLLREQYPLIEYEPVRHKRPAIRLRPAPGTSDPLNPARYIYYDEGWPEPLRMTFDALGTKALSAEYMYFVAKYEAAMAQSRHNRSYWFFPLARIAEFYHVSAPFAAGGLRALVGLGILRVNYGQFGIRATNDEFGAANRYYFEGLEGVILRQERLAALRQMHPDRFELAVALARELHGGGSAKNVGALCDLISVHSEAKVRAVVLSLQKLPPRSLKRRVGYVRAVLEGLDGASHNGAKGFLQE